MGQSPRQILVRTPNFLGDHVLALDFYRGLRAAYSSARITFLCRPNLADFPDQELRDEKLLFDANAFQMGLALRAGNFDLGITLPHSISSAFTLAVSGIPNRVGYAEFGADVFLTHARPWPERRAGKHKQILYLEMLEFLTGYPAKSSPVLATKPNLDGPIVLAPGASISLREWPHYLELVLAMKSRWPKIHFILVGTDEKFKSLATVIPDGVEDRIGQTSLSDLIGICRSARGVIANDSGIAHIAATVAAVPTVVIYGPGDPKYIAPLGPAVLGVRREDLSCSPCEKPYCRSPYGTKACLEGLSVESVLSAVEKLF